MSSSGYAAGTHVNPGKTRDEIESTLRRFGASAFSYSWDYDAGRGVIRFRMRNRVLRFQVALPDREDFRLTESGRRRSSDSAIDAAHEQAIWSRWRSLALVIKAKLIAIKDGILEFDQEFMSYMELPGGRTIGEAMGPELDEAFRRGALPSILPTVPIALLPPSSDKRFTVTEE